ncbi:hypothetical protein ACFQU1_07950 [Chelatococcus sp. GCM10030263]|uniref:hypothetical protein n=1 Tax=Chelatococcus sp. GCM10030263 TaxID=3273387 RepID=UPI00360700D9
MDSTINSTKVLDLFKDEETALVTCEAALAWLTHYRDGHSGMFPTAIFNALIRLRPSCSPEVIVHRIVDGEVFFWLTLRAVDDADPFNGLWHYTGTVDRYGDYLIGGIRRVLDRELGGRILESCRHVASIYPVRSRRSDILSVLFLCAVEGEPSSTEEGRWFSADEAMRLVPLGKGGGIIPSHLAGLSLCLRFLGRPHASAYLAPSPVGLRVDGDEGFSQEIVLVEEIDADAVGGFTDRMAQDQ